MNRQMLKDYLIRMNGAVTRSNSMGVRKACPFCNAWVRTWEFDFHPCTESVMHIREFATDNPRIDQAVRAELRMNNPKGNTSMANVQICERDGNVIIASAAGRAFYQANPNDPGKEYTLCPTCAEELYDFLNPEGSGGPVMAAFDPANRPARIVSAADTTRTAIDAHTATQEPFNAA